MSAQMTPRFCPKCGGKLDVFFGTQTNCPYCGHNLKASFGDPEMQQLSDELDIGLEGLRGIKMKKIEEERARWELQKEKFQFHQEHETKECTSCGTINPARAKYCMECGKRF